MKTSAGFTLIEAIVTMAIFAMLIALAAPSFTSYSQNAKIRSMADSLAADLQTARTEAIRRNAKVEFVLTNDAGTEGNVNTTSLNASGQNWMVRTLLPASTNYEYIAGHSANSGSGQPNGGASKVTITPASNGTGFYQIVFNSLSGVEIPLGTAAPASATFDVTNPTAGTCAASGGSLRCMRVNVTITGQIKVCDPAVNAATSPSDSRLCPT